MSDAHCRHAGACPRGGSLVDSLEPRILCDIGARQSASQLRVVSCALGEERRGDVDGGGSGPTVLVDAQSPIAKRVAGYVLCVKNEQRYKSS